MLKTPITFCNFFFIWFTSFQRKCNQNKKDNSTQIVNSPFFVKIKRSKLVIFKLPLSVQYKNDNKLLKIRLDDVKEQNSVLQTKVNDHNHSMLTMSKKLNKSEARNIALTRFVKETTRNQIHLKNGQSITVYDAIMNKLSPEDKTRVRKTMDLEGNKNSRNR